MLECGHGDARLFRNNTGTGWTGSKILRSDHEGARLPPGSVLILDARPLHAGLCVGSADVIGWRTVTITAPMIGKAVALFTAIECKTGSGRLTAEQKAFLEAVQRAGGIGGVARSVHDAKTLLAVG
jgi:hypothetical protein